MKNLMERQSQKPWKPASPAQQRARERNWAKYQLNGVWARIGFIIRATARTDLSYDLPQLTQEEFRALIEIEKDIKLLIRSWRDNTKTLIGDKDDK